MFESLRIIHPKTGRVADSSPATENLAAILNGLSIVFPEKRQAINYAQGRACFRCGEIRILDSGGNVDRVIPFDDTNRKL
jgi:hypothetical protein